MIQKTALFRFNENCTLQNTIQKTHYVGSTILKQIVEQNNTMLNSLLLQKMTYGQFHVTMDMVQKNNTSFSAHLVSLVDILCQEDPKELYQYHLIGIKCRILNN